MTAPAPVMAMDAVLAARASAGDAKAFRQIYERYAPAVFRFLADMLRSQSAADEATQETFVRAHGRMGGIREGDKLLAWLFGIARNVAFEALRRGKRDAPADDSVLESRATPAPGPELELLGREADELLGAALAGLSSDRRAALLMYLDHGLSYGEIGTTLGWSLAKVKIEIHRARLALRHELSEYLGERS
jgi:RNA polymerase sigma-70 factor, ECF subfamily